MLDSCTGQVKQLADQQHKEPILNQHNFAALLQEHGFTSKTYDFDSTMLGFQHDIFNVLIHDDPIFRDQSSIREQPDCPDALLRCELVTKSDDLSVAVQHFYAQWFAELRYEDPVLELLNLKLGEDAASIHVLTISKSNAMTFIFSIKRGG